MNGQSYGVAGNEKQIVFLAEGLLVDRSTTKHDMQAKAGIDQKLFCDVANRPLTVSARNWTFPVLSDGNGVLYERTQQLDLFVTKSPQHAGIKQLSLIKYYYL